MEEKKSLKDFICTPLGKGTMIAVFYVIIFALFLFATIFGRDSGTPIMMIIPLCFGFFGWKALNKIQPNIFLIMPIVGWIIYFIVKGTLSVLIGMFVAPFTISKKISESIQRNI